VVKAGDWHSSEIKCAGSSYGVSIAFTLSVCLSVSPPLSSPLPPHTFHTNTNMNCAVVFNSVFQKLFVMQCCGLKHKISRYSVCFSCLVYWHYNLKCLCLNVTVGKQLSLQNTHLASVFSLKYVAGLCII